MRFNKYKVEKVIQIKFPNSKIKNYKRFPLGLANITFKIEISNPKKILVVKLSKLKNKDKIKKNNKILHYLKENSLSVPEVYFEGILDKKYVTIMDYSPGEVAFELYKKSKENIKKKILFNAGKNLKKIHSVKIPSFWTHQEHEIKDSKRWRKWTRLRIDKYLNFLKNKLPEHFDKLENKLNEFWDVLKKEKIDLVPLHWDYHLANLNANKKGEITGIFDFDGSMKGHSLADLGQTIYWIDLELNGSKYINEFLKGYGKNFTKKELKIIKGYTILHILAVSRSIWFKQKRLGWLIKKHKKMLDELLK